MMLGGVVTTGTEVEAMASTRSECSPAKYRLFTASVNITGKNCISAGNEMMKKRVVRKRIPESPSVMIHREYTNGNSEILQAMEYRC